MGKRPSAQGDEGGGPDEFPRRIPEVGVDRKGGTTAGDWLEREGAAFLRRGCSSFRRFASNLERRELGVGFHQAEGR